MTEREPINYQFLLDEARRRGNQPDYNQVLRHMVGAYFPAKGPGMVRLSPDLLSDANLVQSMKLAATLAIREFMR